MRLITGQTRFRYKVNHTNSIQNRAKQQVNPFLTIRNHHHKSPTKFPLQVAPNSPSFRTNFSHKPHPGRCDILAIPSATFHRFQYRNLKISSCSKTNLTFPSYPQSDTKPNWKIHTTRGFCSMFDQSQSWGPNFPFKNIQTPYITLSFYKFWQVRNAPALTDQVLDSFSELSVLGRIYVAHEGINAQISVPSKNWKFFVSLMKKLPELTDVIPKFNYAIDQTKAFSALHVKFREQVVTADTTYQELQERTPDASSQIHYLDAASWNKMIDQNATVVDVRNIYESEIGHFSNSVRPNVYTFKESLPIIAKSLKGKENDPILMYCTGGIRCEKAALELASQGFNNLFQLKGGIISYARQVKDQGLESKFHGRNFCFDDRLSESLSSDIVSKCHHCGSPSSEQLNCANEGCHHLFIQCPSCAQKFKGSCSSLCYHATTELSEKEYKDYLKTCSKHNRSHLERVKRRDLEKEPVKMSSAQFWNEVNNRTKQGQGEDQTVKD